MSTEPLIREPGTSVMCARPMFEVLLDDGELDSWHDTARWPEPWLYHDLDREDA